VQSSVVLEAALQVFEKPPLVFFVSKGAVQNLRQAQASKRSSCREKFRYAICCMPRAVGEIMGLTLSVDLDISVVANHGSTFGGDFLSSTKTPHFFLDCRDGGLLLKVCCVLSPSNGRVHKRGLQPPDR
jgi:hypothetical protein